MAQGCYVKHLKFRWGQNNTRTYRALFDYYNCSLKLEVSGSFRLIKKPWQKGYDGRKGC